MRAPWAAATAVAALLCAAGRGTGARAAEVGEVGNRDAGPAAASEVEEWRVAQRDAKAAEPRRAEEEKEEEEEETGKVARKSATNDGVAEERKLRVNVDDVAPYGIRSDGREFIVAAGAEAREKGERVNVAEGTIKNANVAAESGASRYESTNLDEEFLRRVMDDNGRRNGSPIDRESTQGKKEGYSLPMMQGTTARVGSINRQFDSFKETMKLGGKSKFRVVDNAEFHGRIVTQHVGEVECLTNTDSSTTKDNEEIDSQNKQVKCTNVESINEDSTPRIEFTKEQHITRGSNTNIDDTRYSEGTESSLKKVSPAEIVTTNNPVHIFQTIFANNMENGKENTTTNSQYTPRNHEAKLSEIKGIRDIMFNVRGERTKMEFNEKEHKEQEYKETVRTIEPVLNNKNSEMTQEAITDRNSQTSETPQMMERISTSQYETIRKDTDGSGVIERDLSHITLTNEQWTRRTLSSDSSVFTREREDGKDNFKEKTPDITEKGDSRAAEFIFNTQAHNFDSSDISVTDATEIDVTTEPAMIEERKSNAMKVVDVPQVNSDKPLTKKHFTTSDESDYTSDGQETQSTTSNSIVPSYVEDVTLTPLETSTVLTTSRQQLSTSVRSIPLGSPQEIRTDDQTTSKEALMNMFTTEIYLGSNETQEDILMKETANETDGRIKIKKEIQAEAMNKMKESEIKVIDREMTHTKSNDSLVSRVTTSTSTNVSSREEQIEMAVSPASPTNATTDRTKSSPITSTQVEPTVTTSSGTGTAAQPQHAVMTSLHVSKEITPASSESTSEATTSLPFDLYDGNLPCARADELSGPANPSRCEYEWGAEGELPRVRCQLLASVSDPYTALIYNSGLYEAVEGERTPSGRLCLFPVGYAVRRREALGELGDSVLSDDPLLEILRSERGEQTLTVVLSHGFREIAISLRTRAIGPRGLLNADPCRNCTPEVWIFQYKKSIEVLKLYLNRAFAMSLLFQPAYVQLANVWIRRLQSEALLEELQVHGGDRWGDPGDLLPSLRLLRRLDLSGNGLSSINAGNFERNTQIQELYLANNLFANVPDGISLLLDLRVLDLAGNSLFVPGLTVVLRPLAQLRTLNVSHVSLGSLEVLHSDGFDERNDSTTLDTLIDYDTPMLPRLEYLDASWCNVTSLTTPSRRLWRRWPRLRTLRLSGNQLRALPPDLPAQLPALETLDLSRCGLRAAPALRLAQSQRLRRLDLSHNALATPEGALAPHAAGAGVADLDLSGNPLTLGWGARAFSSLGPNASVNLSRTEVAFLSADMLESLRDLAEVDLGGNPIDCTHCAVVGLQEWLRGPRRPKVLVMGDERPLRCSQLLPDRGLPVVDTPQPPSSICNPTQKGVVAVSAVAAALGALAALAFMAFRFRLELKYVLNVLRANRTLRVGAVGLGRRPNDDSEFDAFVCYSKHDRTFVLRELLPELEGGSPPYRLCLHERDFPLGSLIVQNIVECMARSRRTIVVLTHAFVDSQWCQWELEMATHRLLEGASDFLVLLKLEQMEARSLPILLRMLLETRTVLEWPTALPSGDGTGGAKAAWSRLRSALGPPLSATRRESRRQAAVHAPAPAPAHALPALPLEGKDPPLPAAKEDQHSMEMAITRKCSDSESGIASSLNSETL